MGFVHKTTYLIYICKPCNIAMGMYVKIQNLGKGHYYKNHNVENQKEHQKIYKPSLHQKVPF
jgi:hypothetical protein